MSAPNAQPEPVATAADDLSQRDDSQDRVRWFAYALLITLAVGNMTGRIMAVNSVNQMGLESYLNQQEAEKRQLQRPFLSSNDRSRWANVRSLVEYGTFAIDEVVAEPLWNTIDMVKHKDRQGMPRLYSSKPPLLATMIAGEYWIIHRVTGETLGTHPYAIGRFMLITLNVVPLVVMFVLIGRLADRFARTEWARLLIMATATFGTFLSTFAVVLNNHLFAAVSATVALSAMVRIWCDGEMRIRYFVITGLAAAFTAACELPALAFLAALAVALLWRAPRPTLLAFAPAAAVVVAAFFGTNYAAHNSLRPPYMHRSETDPDDNWYQYTYVKGGVERQSYWSDPQGIDRGEPSRSRYALHVLVGHHGIFSLTPVWLLSVLGTLIWLVRGPPDRRQLALCVALVSLVCLAFYLVRPQTDRNYGGMTSGFRWMFWFAPLWLVTMAPAADALAARRWTRGIGLILLAWSVVCASYPVWNPWTSPMLQDFMDQLENSGLV